MIKYLLIFLLSSSVIHAQRIDVDLFGGMANYQGDLQPSLFTLKSAGGAAAVMLKIGLTDKIYIRTGFAFTSLSAFDKFNTSNNVSRNLSFRTALQEYSLGIEYRFLNLESKAISPYIFAGGGVFHYNPYTYYTNPVSHETQRVNLQPLSTEGQGLSAYPNKKPYSLTQFCIPYGFGVKWQINCNINVGIELRDTKTFTDYIDDVSTTYADQDKLRDAKGQLSVDLAYRGDELSGRPYPAENSIRGNPKSGDLFYFAGLTLGLKLKDCANEKFSLGGLFNGPNSLFFRSGGGGRNGGGYKNVLRQVQCPKY